MGIRVLYDEQEDLCALYDSVSMVALSCPLFHSVEMANEFPTYVLNKTGVRIQFHSTNAICDLHYDFHQSHGTCNYCGCVVARDTMKSHELGLMKSLICKDCADCEIVHLLKTSDETACGADKDRKS